MEYIRQQLGAKLFLANLVVFHLNTFVTFLPVSSASTNPGHGTQAKGLASDRRLQNILSKRTLVESG